jgi:hypothetical protein
MASTLLSTEPLDLMLDPASGDLFVDSEGVHFVAGLPGVAQLVGIAIRLFRGEWFLGLDAGVPWFQDILGQKYDEATLRKRLADEISTVPGVVSVTAIHVTQDGAARTVSISWEVTVQFADTDPTTLSGTTAIPV